MSFDYFVELDRAAAGAVDEVVDRFTTQYFRLVAEGQQQQANDLREQWVGKAKRKSLASKVPTGAFWEMIAKPNIDLVPLPPGSFWLRFKFQLAKPYISRDDRVFYIIDNPIVYDKVFQLPMVRPSNWKGNLRAALWQMGHVREDEPQMGRLFGETRGDEGGRAGRLFFYPTFFDTTSLEVINPHDRVRRVGKNLILFESVPQGTAGTFTLLYVPFDLLGTGRIASHEAVEDLRLITTGLQAMFRRQGFSAKRTSGFGVARETIEEGLLEMRIAEPGPAELPIRPGPPPAQPLAKYLAALGRLKQEYLNPEGTFRERSEAELAKMSKSARQEYEKAKKWSEREGRALAGRSQPQAEPPLPETRPAKQWLRREFHSFEQLVKIAEDIVPQLGKHEGEQP
jgi:CRISPR-associated protein Cmr2